MRGTSLAKDFRARHFCRALKADEGKADEKRTFQKLYGTTQGEFGIIRVNMKTMNKFIVFLALRL